MDKMEDSGSFDRRSIRLGGTIMKSELKQTALILAILCVAIWGETFVSSKVVLDHGIRPADLFAFRFLLASIGMWTISHKRLFCNSWKDEVLMAMLGICGGSLYFVAENMALTYSTASNVAIILSCTPLITAFIMAIFYKEERMNSIQIAGSAVAIVGLSLIIFNGEVILKLNPLGDLLAMVGMFCWGFYSLIMKIVSPRYDAAFITRKVFGYGVISIIPYFLVFGWPQLDAGLISMPVIWVNVLYLGIVASLGCFLAWNWALTKLGTVQTTNMIYLQPFFTMIIGYVVLGERITWMAIAGAIILIAGMYLAGKK